MTVPNPERPLQGPSPAMQPGAARVGSSGAALAGGQRPFSNRPILLKPRGPNDLPDVDDEEEGNDDLREVLRNAPAWLISTVFHMVLLIVLGVLAITVHLQPVDIDVAVAQTDSMADTLLDSLPPGDPSAPIDELNKEQVITQPDLPRVDDPLASPLQIADLKLSPVGTLTPSGPQIIEGAPIGFAFKGRHFGSSEKNRLLRGQGGTGITEESVVLGLKWLVKQQRPDGSWSLSGPFVDGSKSENSAAATAMALLAFQGSGHTHRDGTHAATVAKGWKALLKMQKSDGLFTSPMTDFQMLYTHAQCTIALCELYGMTNDSVYRGPAEKAVAFCVSSQDPRYGGWRYKPGSESDTSVTGWFVMALQSARMAKLKVPEKTLERVSEYLNSAQLDEGRRYGYFHQSSPTWAVTAEGLLCRQYLGWRQEDPRLVEGVSALNDHPITYDGGSQHDVYYWYYATQAAHHMEGTIWEKWNIVMRREVPAHQVKMGSEAGSWDPMGDRWGGGEGGAGRLFTTCLSIYMLEVYYRHLPIYSGYRAFDAAPPPTPDAETDKPETADAAKPDATDDQGSANGEKKGAATIGEAPLPVAR